MIPERAGSSTSFPRGFFLLVAALCTAAIARSGSKIPIVIAELPPFPLDRLRDFE
jgi:hypothetical protein